MGAMIAEAVAVEETPKRQEIVVSGTADRPGTYRTIAAALEAAEDGALISIAPGRYEEKLAVAKSVTLAAADGAAGAVELHASGGSAIVSVAAALEVCGLAISADAEPMAVVDIRAGLATLDDCRVMGPARIGVFAQGQGAIVLRDCSIGNARGAGVVVTTPAGSTVEDSVMAGAGASAVVVGQEGLLTLRRSQIENPGANGIYASGSSHVTAEDVTIASSGKAAIAIAQLASATLLRVVVDGSADTDAVFDSSGLIKVTDCSFTGAALHSVHVAGAGPLMHGCTLAGAAKGGLYATGGARAQLADCEIACAEFGLVADQGSEVSLADVRVRGEQGIGVAVSGGGLITGSGVKLSGVSAISGTDGTLRASGSEFIDAADDGIRVLGGGQLTLSNCTIRGARGHGVLVADGASAELRGSAILGNRGDGVRVDTGKQVRLDQCEVRDNGGVAVNDLRGTVVRDHASALRAPTGHVPTLESLIARAEAQQERATPVNLATIEQPGPAAILGAPVPDSGGRVDVPGVPLPDSAGRVDVPDLLVPDTEDPADVPGAPLPDGGGRVDVPGVPLPDGGARVDVPGVPLPDSAGRVDVPDLLVPGSGVRADVPGLPVLDGAGRADVPDVPVPDTEDPADVPDAPLPPSAERIADLVGLDQVRASLIKRLARIGELMANGEPLTETPNLAFIGRSGAGRRTVAALYARALAELDVLVVGDLRIVVLSDVPASWPGQAGQWLAWLFDEATGGAVLLEADEEFWQRPAQERAEIFGALPSLLAEPYAVLLLSSPPEQLVSALAANDAFAACFADCVPFADYTPGQLAVLAVRRLEARGHHLSADVVPALAGLFEDLPEAGAWHAHRYAMLISEAAAAREVTAAHVRSVAGGLA